MKQESPKQTKININQKQKVENSPKPLPQVPKSQPNDSVTVEPNFTKCTFFLNSFFDSNA